MQNLKKIKTVLYYYYSIAFILIVISIFYNLIDNYQYVKDGSIPVVHPIILYFILIPTVIFFYFLPSILTYVKNSKLLTITFLINVFAFFHPFLWLFSISFPLLEFFMVNLILPKIPLSKTNAYFFKIFHLFVYYFFIYFNRSTLSESHKELIEKIKDIKILLKKNIIEETQFADFKKNISKDLLNQDVNESIDMIISKKCLLNYFVTISLFDESLIDQFFNNICIKFLGINLESFDKVEVLNKFYKSKQFNNHEIIQIKNFLQTHVE